MLGIGRIIDRAPTAPEVDAIARLEAGEPLADLVRTPGLDASGIIVAIARVGLGPSGSEGPPLVRSAPPRPELARAITEAALADLLPGLDRPGRLALAAGTLQILGAWDASHEAAQEADDLGEHATAAYWHEIAHRREPDPGNALYWARRVGPKHPAFAPIAEAARPLLEAAADPKLAARLTADGGWSLAGFLDLCGRARPGSPESTLARRLQRVEMIALLDQSLTALGLNNGA